jgi:ferrous iron transport protein A
MNDKIMPLSHLACGERGWVCRVCAASAMRRRLLEVGFIPGTEVVRLGVSPFGDPRVYLVRGKMIAIRSRDAVGVVIRG